jgi:hypothetical protein
MRSNVLLAAVFKHPVFTDYCMSAEFGFFAVDIVESRTAVRFPARKPVILQPVQATRNRRTRRLCPIP